MKLEIASPSLCIQCNITRQIGRPWWNAGPRNFGRIFLIKGVIKGIVAESSMNQLLICLDDLFSPLPPPSLMRRCLNTMQDEHIVHQAYFSTWLNPRSFRSETLYHKREAKFQIKLNSRSLDLYAYYIFISNFSQRLSRGKKRSDFSCSKKKKKLSHDKCWYYIQSEIILFGEN